MSRISAEALLNPRTLLDCSTMSSISFEIFMIAAAATDSLLKLSMVDCNPSPSAAATPAN